jgi:hypothetical protein
MAWKISSLGITGIYLEPREFQPRALSSKLAPSMDDKWLGETQPPSPGETTTMETPALTTIYFLLYYLISPMLCDLAALSRR